jgi:hypothetical protein
MMTRIFLEIAKRARIEALGVAMPGARLPERVRRIVNGGVAMRTSRSRDVCLAAIIAFTCAVFVAGILARAQDSTADDWEKAASGQTSFDVAS